jgi:predicted Rossmann fold nucleotide-binding protein DprA/Smf involved in DNA uptake
LSFFQQEIVDYEKINDPLRQMTVSYRVPSIIDYVNLKSKQINLHRQVHAWERKVQIAEREMHLRQIEAVHYPEKIIHPWKYLQNPPPVLFYKRYKSAANRTNETKATIVKNHFNTSLAKISKKSTINVGI